MFIEHTFFVFYIFLSNSYVDTIHIPHYDRDKGSLVCGVFGPAGLYLPRKLLNPGLKLILPTWLLQGSKITFSFYPCKIEIFHVCMALQKVLEKGGKCRKDGIAALFTMLFVATWLLPKRQHLLSIF